MTFGLLSHTAKGSTGAGFPSSVTTSAIDTTGADIIIVSRADYSNADVGLNDSASNTWVKLIDYQPATSLVYIAVYMAVAPITSASHTFTTPIDGNGTFPSIAVAAFTGTKNTAANDQSATASTAAASTLQPGSITPSSGSALVYGVASSASTSTTITGLTLLDDVAYSGSVHVSITHGYIIQNAAAAINPTFNFSLANIASAVQIDFLSSQLIPFPWMETTGSMQDMTGGAGG